jgi:hypothetical protein
MVQSVHTGNTGMPGKEFPCLFGEKKSIICYLLFSRKGVFMATYTEALISELERTLAKAKAYSAHPGEWYHSHTHAALKRATLDLTKMLAQWRQESPNVNGAK